MSAVSDNTGPAVGTRSTDERPVVLLVDDDLAGLIMAEAALEDAGFTVVQAVNGKEAVACFIECSPDLVIMDAVMPVMDGFEAIARIRREPQGEHVPILMTTGLEDLDSITRAYDEGATDFLTKPLNFFILPHRVQYMLRSKATADALRGSEAKLDNAQRMARMGHWEWMIDTDQLIFSRGIARTIPGVAESAPDTWQAFLALVAESDRPSIAQTSREASEAGTPFSVEFTTACEADGCARSVVLEAEPHVDAEGRVTYMMGTVQDVTERRDAQAQIQKLAYFDIITGLPNRARLLQLLDASIARATRDEGGFAVLFVDLDHFKHVNDTLGHDAGDLLLQQVAGRINGALRASDQSIRPGADSQAHAVARLGGDEFVVLLDAMLHPEDTAKVARRLTSAIREPFDLDGHEASISTTIGISVFPSDGTDGVSLMKHADVAMYHAKERGRDGFQFYSRGLHERALERFSLERELKRALGDDGLDLVFQPKVDMASGCITGCEVLVRWIHPQRGSVSPAEFIPLAEETGLILPLGQWVLDRACHQMQAWQQSGQADFGIAVNCSAVQFTRGDMDRELESVLSASGLAPSCLEVELTESLLMQNIDVGIASLERMKALGVQVAIDDFGTGFSSLSYLKRLPADKLKIDQCFVEDLVSDAGDAAIVSAVTTLSHALGLSVVAEGVETRAQYDALLKHGCDEAQGYLISRPLDAQSFIEWVAAHRVQPGEGPRWLARAA